MTESLRPEPLPQVKEIKPYVPGHAPKKTGGRTFKLASNENPLGASPLAKQAIIDSTEHLEVYPDGGFSALRAAIAQRYGLNADQIMCGAGSDEIFQLLGRAFLTKDDEIIQTTYGFLVYHLVAQQSGAKTVIADEVDLTASVDNILACVTERTKIVFLANPNNPTGTYIPFDEVRRLHAGLPRNVLLVLDGAYAEYVRLNDYSAGIELVSEFENVIMTRTFSKIHGLASLRVGWAYGPAHVIDALHRVRGPFNVSSQAQLAAIAALGDQAFMERSVSLNDAQRSRLTDGVRELGLEATDSVANFVLVRFPTLEGRTASDAAAFLETQGVSVRNMASYKLPEYLRISVGDEEGTSAVLDGLRAFMSQS